MTTFSAITTGQRDAESYIDTTLAGQWSNNVLGIIEGDASASAVRIAGDLAMTDIITGSTYLFHQSLPGDTASNVSSTYSAANANSVTFGDRFIIQRSGTYRVEWAMSQTSGAGFAAGKVYVDGVAFGTELTTTSTTGETMTEDLTFVAGDVVELYQRHSSNVRNCNVGVFKILSSVKPFG